MKSENTPAVDMLEHLKRELEGKFQGSKKHKKNWKYDSRDKQETARKRAPDFIRSSATSDIVWDAGSCQFVVVMKQRWCKSCAQLIPDQHRCTICDQAFWCFSDAVQHIIDSLNFDDETHRRRVLKGLGRGPRVQKDINRAVRELYSEIRSADEAEAVATGLVKVNGKRKWARKVVS